MTVKELKEKLEEMPDEAKVFVADAYLSENEITNIEHRESTRIKDGVVQIFYTYG